MAGRRQHRQRERLPKYVYLSKGRYIFVPYFGGQRGKEIVLCREGTSLLDLWAAYEARTQTEQRGTLRWLSDQYLASPAFAAKQPKTQRDYRRCHETAVQTPLRDNRLLGAVPLDAITPGVVAAYRDRRTQDAPVAANRELAYLSLIFSWGYERELVKINPVKGVKRNREKPRERYIEDWEYQFVYDLAASPPYIRPAMELAYLARLRKVEVLGLAKQDVTDAGVVARRRKGSRTQVVSWSDRLRHAVGACDAVHPISSIYAIHDAHGQPIPESTFDTAWQRLMTKASSRGLKERFTFHDLKAKGVSDFDGDKQRAAGHRTAQAAAVYDRKIETIKPTK